MRFPPFFSSCLLPPGHHEKKDHFIFAFTTGADSHWATGGSGFIKQAVTQQGVKIAEQVRDQDVEINEQGRASLVKGVAKDRRISVADAEMRHGRKRRSVRVDG